MVGISDAVMEQLARPLLATSAFRDKIEYLQSHQEYAVSLLLRGPDLDVIPNCFGTFAYIFGVERQLQEFYLEAVRNNNAYTGEDEFVYLPDEERPGSIGRKALELFLREHPSASKVEQKYAKDGVVVFTKKYATNEVGDLQPFHCGVYLGRNAGEDIFFSQSGKGKPFGFDSVERWLSRNRSKYFDHEYYVMR